MHVHHVFFTHLQMDVESRISSVAVVSAAAVSTLDEHPRGGWLRALGRIMPGVVQLGQRVAALVVLRHLRT